MVETTRYNCKLNERGINAMDKFELKLNSSSYTEERSWTYNAFGEDIDCPHINIQLIMSQQKSS